MNGLDCFGTTYFYRDDLAAVLRSAGIPDTEENIQTLYDYLDMDELERDLNETAFNHFSYYTKELINQHAFDTVTTTAESIAHYCFFHGCKNTTEGNWVFAIKDLEAKFDTKIDEKMLEDIVAELESNMYVLDVWTKEETGEDVIDVNFSTVFLVGSKEDK